MVIGYPPVSRFKLQRSPNYEPWLSRKTQLPVFSPSTELVTLGLSAMVYIVLRQFQITIYLPLHHTGETSVFQDIIGISARHSLKWQRRTLLHRSALIRAQQCIRRIEPWHRAALRRDTAVRQRCRIQLSGLVMNLPGAEVLCIQCIIQSNLHVLYISDINVKTVTYCIHSLS